jgi:hypothetical protein
MDRIRVIVADGWESSAEPSGLLRAVLEREGVEIAGEVLTVSELIELAADEQPDAVVFATRAPQADLDRLRAVAPASKVVFVSPILLAAEAEMAEAVVERADVLASLGPVLVHLCMPGRVNARRAITESFDRPDWIDRVRKDPMTLREILSEAPAELEADRPNVTSLQGEARASDRLPFASEEEVIRLPDLEAEGNPERRATDAKPPPVVIAPARGRRRRWRGLWSMAFITLGSAAFAVLPSTVPVAVVAAPDGTLIPADGDATTDDDPDSTMRRDPVDRTAGDATDPRPDADRPAGDGNALDAPQTPGEHPGGPGAAGPAGEPAGEPAGGPDSGEHHGGPPPVDPVDMPGSSAQHNPHGGPPGHTGEHPEPGGADPVH